jgi:hypothetical protein
MPPPSNTDSVDVPAVDVPAPKAEDVSVVELIPKPKDASGIEPPMPERVVLLVVAPIGDAPDVIGLRPGDASSVAPKATRAGATGKPGPMPSGDVIPSGNGPGEMLIPPTCAEAEPQPKNIAAVAAIITIIKRVTVGSTSFCLGLVCVLAWWCAACCDLRDPRLHRSR